MVRVFTAMWDGECAACGSSFESGDEIYYDEDHDLVAVDCCNTPDVRDPLEGLM